MAVLDGEAERLIALSWASATRVAYRRALKHWDAFAGLVGMSREQLLLQTSRQREQWALRYQVWLMRRGATPGGARQSVYDVSGALRGTGYGSLLELNNKGRSSRIAALRKGALKEGVTEESQRVNDARLQPGWLPLTRRVQVKPRPLTVWELGRICRWWSSRSGEEPRVAQRWCAILTVAYFACWRPSNYTSSAGKGAWRRWLVRVQDVAREEEGVGWTVRTQKTGFPYAQFYFSEGPAGQLLEALDVLLEGFVAVKGKTAWLCGWPTVHTPVPYNTLLQRWGEGVMGAGLSPGVEGPYAMRRGGATFWSRLGLTWQQVGAANGWRSAAVKKYILPKRWLTEPRSEMQVSGVEGGPGGAQLAGASEEPAPLGSARLGDSSAVPAAPGAGKQ